MDRREPFPLEGAAERPVLTQPIGSIAVGHRVELLKNLQIADTYELDGLAAEADEARGRAHESHNALKTSINDVRIGLRILGNDEKRVINKYLENYFDDSVLAGSRHDNFVNWLGDRRGGADDHTVLTFLQNHIAEVSSQENSVTVQRAIAHAMDERHDLEEQGVHEGWISGDAVSSMHEIFNTKIAIGDVWDTHMLGRDGYYPVGADWVVISQSQKQGKGGQQELASKIKNALLDHELNHRRFGNRLALPQHEEESGAEHLALTFHKKGAGVEIVHPDERKAAGLLEKGIYREERIALAMQLSDGWIKIDPKVMLRAYTSGDPNSQEWKAYNRLLDRSWGMHNFRGFIANQMDNYRGRLAEMHPDWTSSRINSNAAYWIQSDLKERADLLRLMNFRPDSN